MQIEIRDFNGATDYFGTVGHQRWAEIASVLENLTPQLQASDQAGKIGSAIFDPKGTNACLTAAADAVGWRKVSVPGDLKPFGKDWDAGKGSVLAEWQFSNYPFLWNNIIRSEAVFQSKGIIAPLTAPVGALVIVTKSGSFPASNSTLYFEQANAQIDTVTTLGVFEIPIRLIGLMIPQASSMEAAWNVYAGRYAREAQTTIKQFDITWLKAAQYGNRAAAISPH